MSDIIDLTDTQPDVDEGHPSTAAVGAGEDLELRWEESAAAWPRSAPGRRRRRLVRGVTALVVVALVVLLALAGLAVRHSDQLASARSAALAAGTHDAELMATYSYTSFSRYAQQIEANSTAQFAANFKKDSAPLAKILTQYKAGSKGSSSGAGVASASTSKATVYVFLNETVSNSQEKATTERARMVVTLVHQHGKWLIANAVVE